MKERPILFSAPMVRALLAGTKTQTRRVVKPQPYARADRGSLCLENTIEVGIQFFHFTESGHVRNPHVLCPYGQPGDRLWVRETLFHPVHGNTWTRRLHYVADGEPSPLFRERASASKTPSIYMPREACRLVLELTSVRVERVQDISEEDAVAEGIESEDSMMARGAVSMFDQWLPRLEFEDLWDSINAKRGYGWKSNPWVWVLSFKRIASAERAA